MVKMCCDSVRKLVLIAFVSLVVIDQGQSLAIVTGEEAATDGEIVDPYIRIKRNTKNRSYLDYTDEAVSVFETLYVKLIAY